MVIGRIVPAIRMRPTRKQAYVVTAGPQPVSQGQRHDFVAASWDAVITQQENLHTLMNPVFFVDHQMQ
jgi:hypothetical protein